MKNNFVYPDGLGNDGISLKTYLSCEFMKSLIIDHPIRKATRLAEQSLEYAKALMEVLGKDGE